MVDDVWWNNHRMTFNEGRWCRSIVSTHFTTGLVEDNEKRGTRVGME
jgi:hypothetical protein